MSAAMQKEVEKHFTRGEFRRVAAGEVGGISYPARVRETYAAELLLDDRRRGRARPPLPHRRRLRLLRRVVRAAARARPARGRGRRRPRLHRRGVGRRGRSPGLAASIGQTKRLVPVVGADLGAVFDRSAERLYLVDEQARRGPGRAGAAALPPPARLERPSRQARLPRDRDEPGRPSRRGLRARGRAHAGFPAGADARRGRGRRRLRGRRRRRLRLPRVPARLRRGREPREAARAARARLPAAVGARGRAARADARPPPGALPVGAQGARRCAS